MGLGTELEFDKYCKVVRSPRVGRASYRRDPRIQEPTTRGYLIRDSDDDFTEISFSRSRSSSYKNIVCGPHKACNETLRRNSVYQCSKEVKQMKKTGDSEARRKIELSPSSDASLSFRIFNSLSLPDKATPIVDHKISSMLSLDEETGQFSVGKTYPEVDPPDLIDLSFCFPSTTACISTRSMSSDGSFAIPMDSENTNHCPCGKNETGLKEVKEQLKLRCDQTIDPLNDGNGPLKRDPFHTLHKSSSEKVRTTDSPCGRESDYCKSSGKSRFSPFRRMLDPIMKSKSMRSLPVSRNEVGFAPIMGSESTKRARALRKSLLNDFSDTTHRTEFDPSSVKKDQQSSVMASSPAHLRGQLSLELKHGVPYFEFSLKDSEDVLSSKTWRANNAYNWVYTFHSINRKRTSNSTGWGTRERRKYSSMVGQMQVSCFFLSEMRHSGAFDNSMVTEFVLYDIMHARRTFAAKDCSFDSAYSVEPLKATKVENLVRDPPFERKELSDVLNHKFHTEDASERDDFDASCHYPWAPVDLHTNLEIAAIIIQVPFEKRESLKEKRGDKLGGKDNLNLFDFSAIDQVTEESPKNISCVKVVTPTGTHGLPSKTEGGGPSPLLERWRSGGHCDCGGWDMACPLTVFDDQGVQNIIDQPFPDNQHHIEMFFQGTREKVPALTISFISEGQYSVDFHAQLSKLQAFSICVAILHGSEASAAVAQEEKRKLPCSNSLKVLLDEEVRFLIEAVADKEKRKLPQPNMSPLARA